MAHITKCEKCKQYHLVGIKCREPFDLEKEYKRLDKLARDIRAFELWSARNIKKSRILIK